MNQKTISSDLYETMRREFIAILSDDLGNEKVKHLYIELTGDTGLRDVYVPKITGALTSYAESMKEYKKIDLKFNYVGFRDFAYYATFTFKEAEDIERFYPMAYPYLKEMSNHLNVAIHVDFRISVEITPSLKPDESL